VTNIVPDADRAEQAVNSVRRGWKREKPYDAGDQRETQRDPHGSPDNTREDIAAATSLKQSANADDDQHDAEHRTEYHGPNQHERCLTSYRNSSGMASAGWTAGITIVLAEFCVGRSKGYRASGPSPQPTHGPGDTWTFQRRIPHAGVYATNDVTREGADPEDSDYAAVLYFWRDDRILQDLTVSFTTRLGRSQRDDPEWTEVIDANDFDWVPG
jgi:hypothetical protein